MRKPSMGGRQHWVMLVDEATKYKKSFFLKKKNEQVIHECGNIHHRTIHTLSILSDTPDIFVKKHDQEPTTMVWLQAHVF